MPVSEGGFHEREDERGAPSLKGVIPPLKMVADKHRHAETKVRHKFTCL